MNNKIFIGLVVLAAGVLAGWYFMKGAPPTTSTSKTDMISPSPAGSNLGPPESATDIGISGVEKGGMIARTVVTYSDTGFAPSVTTMKAGTTVTFVNESSGPMWVASDPHPAHTILPEFDELKGVEKGGTYEFTFAKVGTWGYHNHLNSKAKGTVVVTQ